MRSPFHLRRSLVASLLVVFAVESTALGQSRAPEKAPPTLHDSLTGQALDEYETGRVLFERSDYAGALVKLEHAFDLSSDERLLWDMGSCEINLRHYVRALNLVGRYLHDGDPRITEDQREKARAVVRTVRSLVSTIRLNVNEPGASVFVDDEAAGTTPLAEALLVDLGDRRIRVTKPGFKEQTLVEHVAGATDTTVSVVLEHEVHEARLAVTTDASGAIGIDGTAVAIGRWEGSVAPGNHTIRVTAPGMRPYASDVVVREGESRTVDVTLQHESGGISAAWWIGGAVLAAAGLGVGGYFLFRPSQTAAAPTQGTISPYTLTIQRFH